MKYCGDCKYCYSNETMQNLCICTNGNSEFLAEFVSKYFDPACEDYDGPEDDEQEETENDEQNNSE